MAQDNPKSVNAIFHSSLAIGQCKSKWFIDYPAFLHIQHQSITTSQRFLKLLIFSPTLLSKQRNWSLKALWSSTQSSREKTPGMGIVKLYSKFSHKKFPKKPVSMTSHLHLFLSTHQNTISPRWRGGGGEEERKHLSEEHLFSPFENQMPYWNLHLILT